MCPPDLEGHCGEEERNCCCRPAGKGIGLSQAFFPDRFGKNDWKARLKQFLVLLWSNPVGRPAPLHAASNSATPAGAPISGNSYDALNRTLPDFVRLPGAGKIIPVVLPVCLGL